MEREGGRNVGAAFARAIQVLERDDGSRDATFLVLDGVSEREIDLDSGIVERMTELGITGQGLDTWECSQPVSLFGELPTHIDEVISQWWAGARNACNLAVEVRPIAVTRPCRIMVQK